MATLVSLKTCIRGDIPSLLLYQPQYDVGGDNTSIGIAGSHLGGWLPQTSSISRISAVVMIGNQSISTGLSFGGFSCVVSNSCCLKVNLSSSFLCPSDFFFFKVIQVHNLEAIVYISLFLITAQVPILHFLSLVSPKSSFLYSCNYQPCKILTPPYPQLKCCLSSTLTLSLSFLQTDPKS